MDLTKQHTENLNRLSELEQKKVLMITERIELSQLRAKINDYMKYR